MPITKLRSLDDYMTKLINVSQTMMKRMSLTSAEEQRVSDAFKLLAAGKPLPGSKALASKTTYLQFLQRVQKVNGMKGVVLCAVGLGVSTVVHMGDKIRVDLPHKIKEQEGEIAQDVLQNIANTYTAKSLLPASSGAIATAQGAGGYLPPAIDETQPRLSGFSFALIGDTFPLTAEDLSQVITEGICVGDAYLLDVYRTDEGQFLVLPVSRKVAESVIQKYT